MLEDFGPVIQGAFRLRYPEGLPLEELEKSDRQWLKAIYKYIKEDKHGLDNPKDDHNR
jgi:hypothetical protein